MVEIRPSSPEELPGGKRLWQQVFHDDDATLDFFFTHCAAPEDMLILLEDGRLCSMLVLMPMPLALPDGSGASSFYVYALATDPAARKRGFGRQLLEYTDRFLLERGIDSVTVVPAEASLHRFFSTAGFSPCFSTRQLELTRDALPIPGMGDRAAPVTPSDYIRLREAQLSGTFHVVYDEPLIRYQQRISQMTKGGLFRLEVDGEAGVAAAEYHGPDCVLLKELLLSPEHQERGMALLTAALPADRYHLRTPALWPGLPGSHPQPFGMVKWLDRKKEQRWLGDRTAYLGLGFD